MVLVSNNPHPRPLHIDIHAHILSVGSVGGKSYPLAKKKHSLEFLREKAHLRPRSKVPCRSPCHHSYTPLPTRLPKLPLPLPVMP